MRLKQTSPTCDLMSAKDPKQKSASVPIMSTWTGAEQSSVACAPTYAITPNGTETYAYRMLEYCIGRN